MPLPMRSTVFLPNPATIKAGQSQPQAQTESSQFVDGGLYRGFKKTADKMNQRGPVMQNKYVRFDKTKTGPGARITYYYTLVKHSARNFDRARLSARLKHRLTSAICKNDKIKPSLILGATYTYIYRGNDGTEISRIDVNYHSCDTLPVPTDKP